MPPWEAVDEHVAVGADVCPMCEEVRPGPGRYDLTTRVDHVEQAVARDPERGQLGVLELLTGHRLDGVAPDLADAHDGGAAQAACAMSTPMRPCFAANRLASARLVTPSFV